MWTVETNEASLEQRKCNLNTAFTCNCKGNYQKGNSPSPRASVMSSVRFLTRSTIPAFCKGATRQHSTTLQEVAMSKSCWKVQKEEIEILGMKKQWVNSHIKARPKNRFKDWTFSKEYTTDTYYKQLILLKNKTSSYLWFQILLQNIDQTVPINYKRQGCTQWRSHV